MKKTLLMFTLFFAVMATAFSQTPEDMDATHDKSKKHSKMHKQDKDRGHDGAELGLSADQKSKLKVVRNEYQGKIQAIKTNNAISREEKRTQMATVKADYDIALKNILTADQYAKMLAKKEKNKDEMKDSKHKHKDKNKEKEHKMREKAEGKSDIKSDND